MTLSAEARAKSVGAKRRSFTDKFLEKQTRKAAIDLMCQQCMGGPENEGWRRMIRECTAKGCALFCWRPYQ